MIRVKVCPQFGLSVIQKPVLVRLHYLHNVRFKISVHEHLRNLGPKLGFIISIHIRFYTAWPRRCLRIFYIWVFVQLKLQLIVYPVKPHFLQASTKMIWTQTFGFTISVHEYLHNQVVDPQSGITVSIHEYLHNLCPKFGITISLHEHLHNLDPKFLFIFAAHGHLHKFGHKFVITIPIHEHLHNKHLPPSPPLNPTSHFCTVALGSRVWAYIFLYLSFYTFWATSLESQFL